MPIPGTEIKLCPADDKMEARVRGPNLTPGYWRQPELTEAAFDEEGFYRMGDALRLADPDDPSAGFIFDGRIAEDFKLLTGTWVNVGKLRTAVVDACAPLVQDVVVAGQDRNEIGVLVLLNPNGCKNVVSSLPAKPTLIDAAGRAEVRVALAELLKAHNKENPASSMRVTRAVLLTEPFSIDAGELTDKGYVNQRAVMKCRAESVERLYSEHEDVLRVGGAK